MSRKRISTRLSAVDAGRSLLEQQRLAMIGCLTAGLGHDIRNAVMPALLRADAMSASPDLSASARQDLDGIRVSILSLQHLATGLRLLSQDGSGEASGTHLATWWRDAGPLISASLGAGTQLDVHIPDALPLTKVPPNLIAQVTLAITMNARIWMQGASVPNVTIRAHALPKCAYLTVQYSGQPTEFKRWSPDTSLELPGDTPVENLSGLGLERLREFLAEYDGDLQLNEMASTSGSFTIKLPLQENADGDSASGQLVRLELSDPRQLAVARLILAQRGLVEWREQDADGRDPELMVCDRPNLAIARAATNGERLSAGRVIVLGEPETAEERENVTWVSPSRLGTLADALP